MYAVVRTGGKQYRVAENDVIVVERLAGEAGSEVELDQVLMLDDGKETTVGTPLVDGARVAAAVLDQARGDKIIVFKKKRRKDYTRTKGHRQDVTVLRILEILAKGQSRSAAKKSAAKPAEPAPAPVEEEAKPVAAAPAEPAPAAEAPVPAERPAEEAAAKKAPAKKAAKKGGAKKAGKKGGAKKAAKKAGKKAAKKSAAKKS